MFALHFTAFWLIAIFIMSLWRQRGRAEVAGSHGAYTFPMNQVDAFLFPITGSFRLSTLYSFVAFRAVYRDSVLAAALKAAG